MCTFNLSVVTVFPSSKFREWLNRVGELVVGYGLWVVGRGSWIVFV